MKIISWNIDFKTPSQKNTWSYLLHTIKPDIALLQETYEPNALPKDTFVWETTPSAWGNLIYLKNRKILQVALVAEFPGRILVVKTPFLDDDLYLVNIHVPIDKDGFSRHNLQDMFLSVKDVLQNKYVFVGGDFNFGKSFDREGETSHTEIFNTLLDTYGLKNLASEFMKEDVETFRPKMKAEVRNHIDHIFVSRALLPHVSSFDVLFDDNVAKLSDHNPLIAEFSP